MDGRSAQSIRVIQSFDRLLFRVKGGIRLMGISARLRAFSALALLTFGLLASTPHAYADEFTLDRHYPTLHSFVPGAQPQTAAEVVPATAQPICDVFANGYDPVGATPCAGCFDSVLNFTETDVDCGGGVCNACAVGQRCSANIDCISNACDSLSNSCETEQCSDHRKDGVESDVDCGGNNSCSRSATGQRCHVDGDCHARHICN